MKNEIRQDVGVGERPQQILAYFRLTKIDWIITAVAIVLELINITPSLVTVLGGESWQAVAYLSVAFVLLPLEAPFSQAGSGCPARAPSPVCADFSPEPVSARRNGLQSNTGVCDPVHSTFVVLVAVVTVGSVCQPWVSALLCVPAVILAPVIFTAGRPWDASWYVLASVLWIGGSWSFGRFVNRSAQRITDLERERLNLEAAMEAERAHLAAELHDIVSHAVTVMLLHAA
ncbi:hypothetical protein ACIQC5_11730 [Paenarthrobacter sp. NPDC092416]|uniref:hypothetical protein n=1 Tax=Paenarthrobacter sp. NPDC092416 TaxID=3364386 RepID=UPI003802C671